MTDPDLHDTLLRLRDSVEPPTVDRAAFDARVRTARRRRTAGRAAVGLAGLAAASVIAAGVAAVLPQQERTPPVATAPQALADPTHVVGFVVDGHLVVGGPAGYTETDVPARNVLGVLDGRLVLADATGQLVVVPVDAGGRPGPATRLGEVRYAWLDHEERLVVTQDAVGRYRGWSPQDGSWTDATDVEDYLLDVEGDAWVESSTEGLSLVHNGEVVRTLPAGGGVTGADLSAGVLALETLRGVRFYDTRTGALLSRVRGEGTGALSDHPATYARVSDDDLEVLHPTSGKRTLVAHDVAASEVVWTGPDIVVVAGRSEGAGVLVECDVAVPTCTTLYRDPSGTLQLHS